MKFTALGLWKQEEQQIQRCLLAALKDLTDQSLVLCDDREDIISGKLRPLISRRRREFRLNPTFHHEVSVFNEDTALEPSGHPDFQFSYADLNGEQWNYDVECKLVRIKRVGKNMNYCRYYVSDGILKFRSRKYCFHGFSGTMIGYVQEGDFQQLLSEINRRGKASGIGLVRRLKSWENSGVTQLSHYLNRVRPKDFRLIHLWVDVREDCRKRTTQQVSLPSQKI